MLQNRLWQRDYRDREHLQPDVLYIPHVLPPPSYRENPFNAVTTRFVKTATNKVRCPVFCLAWTPEGRRLITGTSSGEFTLWNGLTFNFETILQVGTFYHGKEGTTRRYGTFMCIICFNRLTIVRSGRWFGRIMSSGCWQATILVSSSTGNRIWIMLRCTRVIEKLFVELGWLSSLWTTETI